MMKLHSIVPYLNDPGIIDICTFADKEDPKKYLTVVSCRYSTRTGEIKISFDPCTMCMQDIVAALNDEKFNDHILQMGICDNAEPLELSGAEKMAEYDHKHDEIFDEEDDSEE